MDNDANSVVNTDENVQDTNSQKIDVGTQENDNSSNTTIENIAHTVDYQKKFSESAKEAQRLYQENQELRKQFELKDNVQEHTAPVQHADNLYPGFEDLDEDARNNLIAYTDTVTRRTKDELYKDPAIAFARKQYNEQVFDSALAKTLAKYPELAATKDEFKSRYYNVNNVPENIESILSDVAKIHLFDKAKDIGVKETEEKLNRVDSERTTAGIKESTSKRSLSDWQRMAQENPGKFAQLSKEYNSDLDSGKI